MEGAKFCIRCGSPVDGEVCDRQSCGTECSCGCPVGGSCLRRNSIFVIILALLLVGVFTVGLIIADTEEDPIPQETEGDVTVMGGLVDASIGFLPDGIVYIGEGSPTWTVIDESKPYLVEVGNERYAPRTGSDVESDRIQPPPGIYDIRLDVDGREVRGGTLVVDGVVTKDYSWKFYDGEEIIPVKMSYSYRISDFQRYHFDNSVPRTYSFLQSDARFVVQDPATDSLVRSLEGTFLKTFGPGSDLHGQKYADFLLSFVQCCISYPTMVVPNGDGYLASDEGVGDYTITGDVEYWMYPMETIHYGMGDCEDTSFLTACLFATAGYDACIMMLSEHVMCGVELESYEVRKPLSDNMVPLYKRMSGSDLNTYFCETTKDVSVPVGLCPSAIYDEAESLDEVTPVRGFEAMS